MKTLQNPAGFRTVFTGSAGINLKQQNRTNHLLQPPDIFSCYRHTVLSGLLLGIENTSCLLFGFGDFEHQAPEQKANQKCHNVGWPVH
jgi:hypothetical protein